MLDFAAELGTGRRPAIEPAGLDVDAILCVFDRSRRARALASISGLVSSGEWVVAMVAR
jgi:hypothetical protein